jgi:hypothetical protein
MACKCDVGLGNTGLPNCAPIASVIKKIILVPTFDSTGARNYIDLTDTLNEAYLTAAINDTDSSSRWFPLPIIENVTSERAESSFEEAPSGRRAFIKQGTRTLTGEIWEAYPQLLGKIKASRCVDVSAFIVDYDGNIVGISNISENRLYPIKLDKQSIDANLIFATDSTKQKLSLTFAWDDSEKDEEVYMLVADEDFTFDALAAKGLLDIYSEYSSISTTGFVAELYGQYGSRKSLITDSGLVAIDFTLYNVTTSAAIVITSVTESPDGTYTFVIPAQTSADVLRLTPSKNGRDYTNVVSNTILIP